MTFRQDAAARGKRRDAQRRFAVTLALAVLLVAAYSAAAAPVATARGSFVFLADTVTSVAFMGDSGWSVYGAERSQPVATGGK